MPLKFSHEDCFKNACSPRKFSRSLKSEDNDKDLVIEDKDKDFQISSRGSSRTRTFLEDNNTALQGKSKSMMMMMMTLMIII